jgi:hypothetical protein
LEIDMIRLAVTAVNIPAMSGNRLQLLDAAEPIYRKFSAACRPASLKIRMASKRVGSI